MNIIFCMINSIHDSKTHFYNYKEAIQKISETSWLLPGVISTIGAVLAATINSSLESSSRVYQIIGSVIGVGSIVIGTDICAIQISDEENNINRLMNTLKKIQLETESIKEKIAQSIKKSHFKIVSFSSSLSPEQAEDFFSLLGVYAVESDPISVSENLGRAFLLTEKQYELLNTLASTFKEEKKEMNELEIICKLTNVKEKNLLAELENVLALTSLQKKLFYELISSLDTSVISLAIETYLQSSLNFKIVNHLEKLKTAQRLFLFAPSLAALLTIINPCRLIGRVQPLSALWTLLQFGSLVAGAAAVGYIVYHCFYSNRQEKILIQADQTQQTLRALSL